MRSNGSQNGQTLRASYAVMAQPLRHQKYRAGGRKIKVAMPPNTVLSYAGSSELDSDDLSIVVSRFFF